MFVRLIGSSCNLSMLTVNVLLQTFRSNTTRRDLCKRSTSIQQSIAVQCDRMTHVAGISRDVGDTLSGHSESEIYQLINKPSMFQYTLNLYSCSLAQNCWPNCVCLLTLFTSTALES